MIDVTYNIMSMNAFDVNCVYIVTLLVKLMLALNWLVV